MKKKLLLLVLAMVCAVACAFGLAACGGNGDDTGDTQMVAVESVTLNKTTLTLEIDGEETLTATVTPENATDKTVTWSSSAPTIASVDNAGKVTAIAEGNATITAKTANNKTATCAVTVNAPAPTTEVTAAEWTAAFNVTNYTFDHITDNGTTTYELESNKFHFDSTEHQILSIEDNKGYIYTEMKENGVSIGWEKTNYGLEDITSFIETYKNVLLSVKDSFSDFTYTEGKYVANQLNITIEAMGMNIVSAEITFENKNLTSVKLTTTAMGTFSFEKFGTTTITLPTEYTESSNVSSAEVTSEQWIQVFESINNFTVEASDGNGDYLEIGKFDGSTLLYTNFDGLTVIYQKDGNSYSRYQTSADIDGWYKGAEEAEEYDYFFEFSDIIGIFKSDCDLFTFSDGSYTLDKQIKNYPIFRFTYNSFTNVKVTFENGTLIDMEFEATRASTNKTIKVVISNIGNTAISVPTEYTEIK